MSVNRINSISTAHHPELSSSAAQAVPEGVRPRGEGIEPKAAGQTAEVELGEEELAELAEQMNDLAARFRRHVAFEVHNQTGTTIIKVVDNDTDEVIRQIPPEEMLGLMARMTELVGMLFNSTA